MCVCMCVCVCVCLCMCGSQCRVLSGQNYDGITSLSGWFLLRKFVSIPCRDNLAITYSSALSTNYNHQFEAELQSFNAVSRKLNPLSTEYIAYKNMCTKNPWMTSPKYPRIKNTWTFKITWVQESECYKSSMLTYERAGFTRKSCLSTAWDCTNSRFFVIWISIYWPYINISMGKCILRALQLQVVN